MSNSGRPHDKAVAVIIQKLDIFTDGIVKATYSRNGRDGVTVQYKDSVLQKVKEWLELLEKESELLEIMNKKEPLVILHRGRVANR